MECEVCGSEVDNAIQVRIEGVLMHTCAKCAKLGVKEVIKSKPGWSGVHKFYSIPPSEKLSECIEDYGEVIRIAREKSSLTREQLGKIINERASVIARLESKKMEPDVKLARKLEKALNIKLLEEFKEEKIQSVKPKEEKTTELTIGDIIKIKKR